MEARRRLAHLYSHLRPTQATPANSPTSKSSSSYSVSVLNCASRLAQDNKGNQDGDCVFCKIIRGDSPALKVIGRPSSGLVTTVAFHCTTDLYEDDICLCILDKNPVSHGHSLIISKSHFPSLRATPPPVVGAMCSKVPFISDAVMKATGSDSFNLLVNNGASSGQVIFHTHLHIIPRKARDCLWTSESLPRRPLKLDLETSQFADRIREALLILSDNSEDSKGQGSTLLAN